MHNSKPGINRGGPKGPLLAEHHHRFCAADLSTLDIVEMTNVPDVPPVGSVREQ